MNLSRPETHGDSFDLTPMIDVVLLLIIFFMLSSRFADATLTNQDLPRESGETAPVDTQQLIIDLDAEGRLFVHAKPILLSDVAELAAPLRELAVQGSAIVVIRADRRCRAVHLNRLAAELSASGIRDWAFTTQPDGSTTREAAP